MGATVIVSLKIMPNGPDVDLSEIESQAKEKITAFGGTVGKVDEEPVAFGLKAKVFMFSLPEEKGSTEDLETGLAAIDGVSSVQITDVRRAVG